VCLRYRRTDRHMNRGDSYKFLKAIVFMSADKFGLKNSRYSYIGGYNIQDIYCSKCIYVLRDISSPYWRSRLGFCLVCFCKCLFKTGKVADKQEDNTNHSGLETGHTSGQTAGKIDAYWMTCELNAGRNSKVPSICRKCIIWHAQHSQT